MNMINIITAMIFSDLTHNDFANKDYPQFICCVKCEGRLTVADRRYQIHDGSLVYVPPHTEVCRLHAKDDVIFTRVMFETDEYFTQDKLFVLPKSEIFDFGTGFKEMIVYGQLDCTIDASSIYMDQCRLIFKKIDLLKQLTVVESEVNDYKADIISNITKPNYTIKDFMMSADITRSNVSKKFKNATRETAKQFYDRKKMQYAEQILINNIERNIKLDELADLCGYDEHYYFLRLFKKHTGMSIAEFRKKHGAK